MPAYKLFRLRNPDYDQKLWSQCRAFYAGGSQLLQNRAVMTETFPKHLAENPSVYEERMRRAWYIPYPGEIIDSLCAGLFSQPLVIRSEPENVDEYYSELFDDVSPPGGRAQTINQFLKEQVLTALLCRRAWSLVDLPDEGPEVVPETAQEEDDLGLRNAYIVCIDPENVLDWEESEDGELEWAMVLHRNQKRNSLLEARNMVEENYTIYYRDRWERYSITYKAGEPPNDEAEVPLIAQGVHSFGKVPLVRLELCPGLWAMGKILPIAIAHMNLRNALSWAEYKSLFPVLTAFKQGQDPLNPATDDLDRELNQTFGQGYIAGMAEKDRLEYIGPDTSAYEVAARDLAAIRDEMHRVLHQMAMSVDNSGAALQRSADSKQVDKQSTAIILSSLGQTVRDHVIELMNMVVRGRVDGEIKWRPEGMEKFDDVSSEGLLGQAETVDTISIPSAKFKQLWTYNMARKLLGDNATDEDLEEIRKELEENITNEQFAMDLMAKQIGSGSDEQEPGDEDDEDPDGEDVQLEPRPAGRQQMFKG